MAIATTKISVVQGDTYDSSDTGRAINLSEPSTDGWPALTGGACTFTAFGPDGFQKILGTVTIVAATGDPKSVKVEFTASETASLRVGYHIYTVRVTISGRVISLAEGVLEVARR